MSATALSGHQYALVAGDYRASIASVGATVRRLTHRDRDLVVPFEAEEVRPAYRGATLAPWPNRVVDGRYRFDGAEQQLALSEPARGHALHGLVAWLDFGLTEHTANRVSLVTDLPAQQGYPYPLTIEVIFDLDDHGLRTTVIGTNRGDTDAPWGTAPHPYLVAGPGRADDWQLLVPAGQVLTVTEDRLIPVGLADVADHDRGALDFRTTRPVGDTFVDHAYTGLQRGADDLAWVEVTAAGGSGVAMSWGPECPWVQIHTGDLPDDPEHSRIGLAVEPMTCAPDAFNSGAGLIRLAPAESRRASWTISAVG